MASLLQSFCQQVVDGARRLLLLSGGLLAFYKSSTLSHTVQPWDLLLCVCCCKKWCNYSAQFEVLYALRHNCYTIVDSTNQE